jgi:hypothetical protein
VVLIAWRVVGGDDPGAEIDAGGRPHAAEHADREHGGYPA